MTESLIQCVTKSDSNSLGRSKATYVLQAKPGKPISSTEQFNEAIVSSLPLDPPVMCQLFSDVASCLSEQDPEAHPVYLVCSNETNRKDLDDHIRSLSKWW